MLTLLATQLLTSPAQAADATPPKLESLSYSPASVDVTDGAQSVTVTVRITDSGGAAGGYLYFRNVINGQNHDTALGYFSLTAGTAQDGTWQTTITVPAGGATRLVAIHRPSRRHQQQLHRLRQRVLQPEPPAHGTRIVYRRWTPHRCDAAEARIVVLLAGER